MKPLEAGEGAVRRTHIAEDKFSRLDLGDLLFELRVIPSKRDVDEIRSDNSHNGRVIGDLGDTFREHSSEGSLPCSRLAERITSPVCPGSSVCLQSRC